MIHDSELLDRLAALAVEQFDGEVFRATRIDADATTPSIYGERWSPPPDGEHDVSILYTSLERDGALAEVCSSLAALNPIPAPRPIKVSRLSAAASRTLRLARAGLQSLGVDMQRFGERDYGPTQKIGAALAFLEFDGLIAPSARWACDNLMIFTDNLALTERPTVLASEEVEWQGWARQNGLL